MPLMYLCNGTLQYYNLLHRSFKTIQFPDLLIIPIIGVNRCNYGQKYGPVDTNLIRKYKHSTLLYPLCLTFLVKFGDSWMVWVVSLAAAAGLEDLQFIIYTSHPRWGIRDINQPIPGEKSGNFTLYNASTFQEQPQSNLWNFIILHMYNP